MNTFETKFGFYPTSKETFLKLKELHKWYWKTLYAFHRWFRWDRKQPQNRHGAEPSFYDLFILDKVWCRITQGQLHKHYKYFPKTVTDHGIIELYQQARRPSKEPVAVFSKETLERINELHTKLTDTVLCLRKDNKEIIKEAKVAS